MSKPKMDKTKLRIAKLKPKIAQKIRVFAYFTRLLKCQITEYKE